MLIPADGNFALASRSRKTAQNVSFFAIVAVDASENEPLKHLRLFFHYVNPLCSPWVAGRPGAEPNF